jgi:hypothetical protein
MSVPKAIIEVATIIKTETELLPEAEDKLVIPQSEFRDSDGVLFSKEKLGNILRRLQELKTIVLIDTSDLRSHKLTLQSDKVILKVKRAKLSLFLSEEADSTEKQRNKTSTEEKTPKSPPPGWGIEKIDGQGKIVKNGEAIFTFPNDWSSKFKYFDYAWNHKYHQTASYKELYESMDKEYPNQKGENWKTNKAVRVTMNKLRKEFKRKKVPITIQTKNGIKVFVSK